MCFFPLFVVLRAVSDCSNLKEKMGKRSKRNKNNNKNSLHQKNQQKVHNSEYSGFLTNICEWTEMIFAIMQLCELMIDYMLKIFDVLWFIFKGNSESAVSQDKDTENKSPENNILHTCAGSEQDFKQQKENAKDETIHTPPTNTQGELLNLSNNFNNTESKSTNKIIKTPSISDVLISSIDPTPLIQQQGL